MIVVDGAEPGDYAAKKQRTRKNKPSGKRVGPKQTKLTLGTADCGYCEMNSGAGTTQAWLVQNVSGLFLCHVNLILTDRVW